MRFHVQRLVRAAFIVVVVILIWTLVLTYYYDISLTSPVKSRLPPAKRFPIRSWSKNQTHETIHFKDVSFNFRILQFPEALTPLCEAGNLTLLVIVQSAPSSVHTRNAIRQTWASNAVRSLKSGSARVIFLIGDGATASEDLKSEIDKHKDIILIDTEETYKNLVFKTAITLFISQTHCPAPFLLKVDQDVAFGIDRFISQVNSAFHSEESAIYCRVRYFSRPYRENSSRWYISERHFDGWFYPRYCAGPAYVLTSHAVDALLNKLPEFELVRIEDVFFTGLLASAADVRRVGMQAKFKTEYWKVEFSSRDCSGLILAIHNLKKEQDIGYAWQYLTKDCWYS